MIDGGADWLHRLRRIASTAIVLTRAHADHVAPRAQSTATRWRLLRRLPIPDRRTMPLHRTVRAGGVRFRAVAVRHSIRAPAVGYRVSANGSSFFYLPDVAKLPKGHFAGSTSISAMARP